jgi:ectoine hydroxylase-related dioxygenase (phytanoyl-CoA dioxygenase family)
MSHPRLDDETISRFRKSGFASLPPLVDDIHLEEIREVYDQLLSGELDTTGSRDDYLGDITRQLVGPEHCHELFRDNAALEAGRAIAAQLFDWEPLFLYSQLLFKPPGHPHETPWHQDAAYTIMPFTPAGSATPPITAQFWMALDDADQDNGCMHFHPTIMEEGLLPHYVVSGAEDNPARLLGLVDTDKHVDPDKVIACPLAAGCATVHVGGTLHYTPANRSTRPRRAYIFNFADRVYIERLGRPSPKAN